MKNLNKIFLIALAAAGVSSCADLDTQYYGSYVTDAQKQSALESNPDLADAAVSAVFTQFGAYQGQYGGSTQQYDFGYPAIMIGRLPMLRFLIPATTGLIPGLHMPLLIRRVVLPA